MNARRTNDSERHSESSTSTESLSDYIPTPPDGGYGWLVVFAAFFCNFIVDGIAFTFGVFVNDLRESFGVDMASAALIGSLNSGFYLLSGTQPIVYMPYLVSVHQVCAHTLPA